MLNVDSYTSYIKCHPTKIFKKRYFSAVAKSLQNVSNNIQGNGQSNMGSQTRNFHPIRSNYRMETYQCRYLREPIRDFHKRGQ